MTLYSTPIKRLYPGADKRTGIALASEKDSGVKHTYMGSAGCGFSFKKKPTDAIGTCAVRIQNAVTGSRYRLEVASTGTLVDEGNVASDDFTVNVPLYAAGNANNTLKVKIRKGTTAPKYLPFETQVTAMAAGALAFISQIPDPIA